MYAFDLVWLDLPSYVRPEQSIFFKIRLRTNAERTTSSIVPEVTVQEGAITLLGFCGIRVVPKYESAKDAAEVTDLNDITLPLSSISPNGAFSKENDYTKAIATPPLPDMPCSFNMERLSRYYKARINMTLMAGGQKVTARREFPVIVLPSSNHERSSASDSAQAGPSYNVGDDDQSPAYSRETAR